MKKLKNTIVYLAGNLESTSDAENWRNSLTEKLTPFGVKVLDPTKKIFNDQISETEESRQQLKKWRENGDYHLVAPFMKEIIRRDLRAVDMSNFLICRLEPTKVTWGTTHEIVVASQQRKPILMILEDKTLMPLWLMGLVNMDFVFDNEEELMSYIKDLDSGKKFMDSKYWKILHND